MKTIKTCVTALISALLVFSPVAYADKWSDQFPHIKATGDIPGDAPPVWPRGGSGPHQQSHQRHDAVLLGLDRRTTPPVGQNRQGPCPEVTGCVPSEEFIFISLNFFISDENNIIGIRNQIGMW